MFRIFADSAITCSLPGDKLAAAGQAEVRFQRTPDAGLQPRLIQSADGAVHLLYFKKRLDRPAAREGSLYYRPYQPEQNRFGAPVKVLKSGFQFADRCDFPCGHGDRRFGSLARDVVRR